MNFRSHQKGVALLWALILTTVLLVITGSMASVIIRESRMTLNILDSSQAYSNAKSGIAWAESYLDGKTTLPVPINETFSLGSSGSDGTVRVIVTNCITPDCIFQIESIGTDKSGLVTRRIDSKIKRQSIGSPIVGTNGLNPNDMIVASSNTGSFKASYDFWRIDGPVALTSGVVFGLKTQTAGGTYRHISVFMDTDESLNLLYRGSDGENHSTPLYTPPTPRPDDPYKYHMTIQYVKDTNIIVKIQQTDANDSLSPECVAYKVIDVSGIDFGDLNRLRFEGNSGSSFNKYYVRTSPNVNEGDGSYFRLSGTTNSPGNMGGYLGSTLYDNFYLDSVQPAVVTEQHPLTVGVSPALGGTVTDNLGNTYSNVAGYTHDYPAGTSVTLTAQANDGYSFTGWGGGGCSGTGSCLVTMDQARNISASFEGAGPVVIPMYNHYDSWLDSYYLSSVSAGAFKFAFNATDASTPGAVQFYRFDSNGDCGWGPAIYIGYSVNPDPLCYDNGYPAFYAFFANQPESVPIYIFENPMDGRKYYSNTGNPGDTKLGRAWYGMP